jgi:hypothetical protein
MSGIIPKKLSPCAVNLLARPEWFSDPGVVLRANLAPANLIARFLSSPRFSGTDYIWAITLGSTIYIRMLDQYNPHAPVQLALLAHEIKHVEQYEREGLAGFLGKYLQSYASRGGYSSAVNFEAEAYAFQKQVEEHLTQEFAANGGTCNCVEMGDPHTANLSFVKTTPAVFKYP